MRFASIGLILFACAAAAQTPLPLSQTRYRFRAGDRVSVDAPPDTLDFIRNAKTRTAGTRGFAIGPDAQSNGVLLGASLNTRPGTYTLVISAASPSGERREATVTVTVDALPPVPSNASGPPVVLLNGWQISLTNSCPMTTDSSGTFGALQQTLESQGLPVYFFDNCTECPNCSIEQLGSGLTTFLSSLQYATGASVPQADLVGHSMGGLIARAHLAGLQASGALFPPPNSQVRKLIEIATPNFGSFLAAEFSSLLASGTQASEMIPGSSFLWNLDTWNQRGDDLRGVDALSIVGNAGAWKPGLLSLSTLSNASDGVVSLTSGSIGFAADPSRTRVVPYCHIDSSSELGAFIECSASGIAKAPETAQIVTAFLQNNTTGWMSTTLSTPSTQNSYLSQDGGLFFGRDSPTGAYDLLSQVTWGTVSLTSGPPFFYGDFLKGSGAFEATGAPDGTTNCGAFTEPPGYFSAVRCKLGPSITSVGPLASAAGKVVETGTITISGSGFGTQCATCGVSISPGPVALQVTSLQVTAWSDQSITAVLPATAPPFIELTVTASAGTDEINLVTNSTATVVVTSVSNAASNTAGAIAPGEIIAIKGSGLGPATGVSFTVDPVTGTVDTTLSGTRVLFGTVAAPLLYSSNGQVNAIVPYEIAGQSQIVMQVQYGGVTSTGTTLGVACAAPGIFTSNSTGIGSAAALNQNGSLNSPSNPAAAGSYATLFFTGGGQTTPAGVTGSVTGLVLKYLMQNVGVSVGGQLATVQFDGAAPLSVDGFLQLNIRIPSGISGTVPVVLNVGGILSPTTATLSVQ